MTRKEQIIEILNKELWISEEYDPRKDKSQHFIEGIDKAAEEILSLPLDVPSEEEIRTEFAHNFSAPFEESNEQRKKRQEFNHDQSNKRFGVKWAINEILKRNKPE